MLGPAKPRRLVPPVAVSLEDLVPQDNFDRYLEAKLDQALVREWTSLGDEGQLPRSEDIGLAGAGHGPTPRRGRRCRPLRAADEL